MTLWGQSAGAISVGYYDFAHAEDPIVTGMIMDSGNELLDITSSDVSHSNFTFVASKVGCGGQKPENELECMRKVPADVLEKFLQKDDDEGATAPSLTFAPVKDEVYVYHNYTERARAGKFAKIVSPHCIHTAPVVTCS
jgi:carboxylesterase type B